MQLLLETNADANRKGGKDGRAPLDEAAKNGHEAVVRLLLEAKPDINVTDSLGETPLFQSSDRGAEVVMQILLEAKAQVDTKEIVCGKTALH